MAAVNRVLGYSATGINVAQTTAVTTLNQAVVATKEVATAAFDTAKSHMSGSLMSTVFAQQSSKESSATPSIMLSQQTTLVSSHGIVHPIKPLSTEEIVKIYGQTSGNKAVIQAHLEYQKTRITEAQLESVRSDLCVMTDIATDHYSKEKMEVFDLLIQCFDSDRIKKTTQEGVWKVITKLHTHLLAENAQHYSVDFQRKIARTFSAAIELYLRHYSAGHASPILGKEKDALLDTEKKFELLNTRKDAEIEFYLQLSLEGSKRITTERTAFSEFLKRGSVLVAALDAAWNGKLSECVQQLQGVLDGLQDKITEKWFDTLFLMRDLVKLTSGVDKKVHVIITMLAAREVTEAKEDWKFLYGALTILRDTIADVRDPVVLEAALFGKPVLDGNKVVKYPGAVDFIEFGGYLKKVTVDPFRTNRRADEAIHDLARKLCESLIKKMLETQEGRSAWMFRYDRANVKSEQSKSEKPTSKPIHPDFLKLFQVPKSDKERKKWMKQVPKFVKITSVTVIKTVKPKIDNSTLSQFQNANSDINNDEAEKKESEAAEENDEDSSCCVSCYEFFRARFGRPNEYTAVPGS